MDFHTFFPILLSYVIPWGCMLTGAQIVWSSIGLFREAASIVHWQKASGVIRRSLIKKTENGSHDQRSMQATTTYTPDILYDYAVDGHTILGQRLSLHERESRDSNEIKKLLKDYPLGKTVKVFYNPRHVEQSTLSQIVSWHQLAGCLVLGILLLSLGIILSLWLPGVVIQPS